MALIAQNSERAALLAAHNSLLAYAKYQWRGFQVAQHHVLIAQHLEAVERGEIKRLIIQAPPRHGKSLLTSENFPSWYLGRNPTHEILFSTYNQRLANKFGRRVRNLMLNPGFKRVFPECTVSRDSKAKNQFNTKAGGTYNAVGVGGGATGEGAHLAILDDTLKGRKQAESKTFREDLKEFFASTVYTRLTPDGAIVIMQTRWHEDDIIGYVLKEHPDEGWVLLSLPAINEKGEALWPERFSLARLEKRKKILGPYNWDALYMQRPSAPEGNIFKKAHWKFWDYLPPKFDRMISSWDMTFDEGENNDYVVGQVWGQKGADFYLVHQIREKMDLVDTVLAFKLMNKQYPEVQEKLIEKKANGPAVKSAVKRKISGIIEIEPQGSKPERAHSVKHLFVAGNIWIPRPEKFSWVKGFMERAEKFPRDEYDDEVDSMTQALIYLNEELSDEEDFERFLAL